MSDQWVEKLTSSDSGHSLGPVAVMIDGDNIRADFAGRILTIAMGFGPLLVKRVYGDVKHLGKWSEAPGFRLIHSGGGKNSTDMLLAIEAVALMQEGGPQSFVLVSSDADFSHLAHHLRESGKMVIGVGEAKTADRFRKACSRFVVLPVIGDDAISAPKPEAVPALSAMDQFLRDLIKGRGDKAGFHMTNINQEARKMNPPIKISDQPERTWRAYLLKRPDLYQCDPKGPNAQVRWISRG